MFDAFDAKKRKKKLDDAERKAVKPKPKPKKKPAPKKARRYEEGSVSVDFWGG